MKPTQLLNAYRKEDLSIALTLLQQGELVAVPTETVYGLASDAKNPDAVRKIFIAKNRPATHPLIVHIASFEKLQEWAKEIPPMAVTLAKHFWPGPLTLLLNKSDNVNDVVTGGLPTIGVRVPQNETLLALLQALNTGLAAPSANLHKKISPTTAEHVMAGLSGKIAAVIDAGPCSIGLESTILDVTTKIPRILRPGPITQHQLETVLQMPVLSLNAHSYSVAGNMAVHYQPETPSLLMTIEAIREYLSAPQNSNRVFALMHYSPFADPHPLVKYLKVPSDKIGYAKILYNALHTLDNLGAAQILIEKPPPMPEWSDILDRLSKATG